MAAQEPFFIDDNMRFGKPLDLVLHILQNGEFFLHLTPDDDVIGFTFLRDISHQRHAYVECWAHPAFRTPEHKAEIYWHFRQIIDYAFAPFPEGLGLNKLKADICVANEPSLVTAHGMGFRQVGRSPLDLFHNGRAYDSVLLELHNPEIFRTIEESINPNGRIISEGTTATSLHASASSAAIHTTPELPEHGTAGEEWLDDSDGGIGDRNPIAQLLAAEGGPPGPDGPEAV